MNRRILIKTLITVLTVTLLLAAAAVCAWAAPAKPGSGRTGSDAACRSHVGSLVTPEDIPSRQGDAARAPSLGSVEKNIPLLTIVVGFSNIPYRNDFDWSATMYSGEKSLAAYYSDMSFGKFTFAPAAETSAYGAGGNTNEADAVNDGVVHVTLDTPHKDWANEDEYPSQALAMIDAIAAADAYVDFSAFDADGNGKLTENEFALGFVFAGYEASAVLDYPFGVEYYLWAHAWSIGEIIEDYAMQTAVPSPDGVEVSAYIAIAEQLEENVQAPISVLAHELGHYLGLPDLYDTTYTYNVRWAKHSVSNMSLMADGCWGIDPNGGYIPYSLDVWSRCKLGWTDPSPVKTDGDYYAVAQSYTAKDAFKAILLPTQREKEYYLIENRQYTKWDAGLSTDYGGNGGLVIWHIDDAVFEQYGDDNKVNDADHRPAVMPLYPEQLQGEYTYIGNTTVVDTAKPFMTASVWEELFPAFEGALDLPLYGKGTNADKRGSRTLSGIKLRFPSESAAQMTVRLYTGDHAEERAYVGRVEPKCTTAGKEAHWACTYCGAAYLDEEGTEPLTADQLAIPAPGHTFAHPEWVWARDYSYAYASFTCEVCTHGTTVYDRDPILTEVSPATPDADRTVTYTAYVELDGTGYSDTTNAVPVPGTADRAAADQVQALIRAIGRVEYTDESKAKIDAARAAYEALTPGGKALVNNLATLKAAENRFAELEAAASQPGQPEEPSGDDLCPLDGQDHGSNLMGRLIRFFHTIRWWFQKLFGKA